MKREICVKRWRCHKTNASRVALSYSGPSSLRPNPFVDHPNKQNVKKGGAVERSGGKEYGQTKLCIAPTESCDHEGVFGSQFAQP